MLILLANENGSLSERGYHSEDGSLSELSDIEDPFIDNNLATPSSTQSPQPHPLYPGAQIGESMGALLLKSVALLSKMLDALVLSSDLTCM